MLKKAFLFSLFAFCCQFLCSQASVNLYRSVDRKAMDQWVDSVYSSLNMDEKIGQLFMVVADPSSSYHERIVGYINDMKIGGVLFSGGRLMDQAESINLYQKESRVPLFISFDGEWGLAMRLKDDTPLFPHNMMIGAVQDNDLIREYGKEVGRECNELGVHINFAPDLDVNVNPANPVIGNRSFGENPYLVAEKGIAYSKGLESARVISVGKHFPGHGDTATDSHKALPRIDHSRARLDSIELYPFVQYINSGFAGMMTGHLSVPALDSTTGLPSSLSPRVVNDLLIEELGFEGLTFTDALVMGGASEGRQSNCVLALLAGNDILLSPGKPVQEYSAVRKAVENGSISRQLIDAKCRKVLEYKYIVGLNSYKAIEVQGLYDCVNSVHAELLVQKLNEAAITLLKDDAERIPLKRLDKRTAVLSIGENKKTPFQETFSLYTDMDFFCLPEESTDVSVFGKLKSYDRVVCAIHSQKISDLAALQSLCKANEVHLCFFTSPYRLARFKESIASAASVTLAYENTVPAQKAAAGVLMGGVPAEGRLPVTIAGLFEYGSGILTSKSRLSYGLPEEVGMSGKVLDRIEKVVAEGIGEKAFPGCQVLVAKDGVVVYSESFGYFDYTKRRAVTNDDIYDLASLTKALSTVPAVMKLYDSGLIKLQDRLSKWIPEMKGSDKELITIQNALYHESGLVSFLPFYASLIDADSYEGPLFARRKDLVYSVEYDKDTYMRKDFSFRKDMVSCESQRGFERKVAEGFFVKDNIEEDVIREIVESPLRKNKNYSYSDLNFILLKKVMENVSGEDFDSYLDSCIYSPLGASSTLFCPLNKFDAERIVPTENDNFLREQLLQGYVHDEAAAILGGVSGNAGLFSNANDIAKILQMLINEGIYGGERYFSKETALLFTGKKSLNSRRGLGFDKPDMTKLSGNSCALASPACTFGHTGYTGTCFWVDPDNKLIFVFLSNRVHPSRMHTKLMSLNIRPRIHDIIYESMGAI